MINRFYRQFCGLAAYMPQFLILFAFLLAGYFIMASFDFVVAMIIDLVFAGFFLAVASNFHSLRQSGSHNPQAWSQAAQLRFDAEKNAYVATHDLLTGLYNRSWLDRFLNDPAFAGRYLPYGKCANTFSVVIIDINNIRMLNNHFGLETGNRCLNHLVGVIRDLVEIDHILVRASGEEFVVIMPNASSGQVNLFLSRLDQAVFQSSDYPIHISWSSASTAESADLGCSVLSLAEDRLVTNKLLDRNSSRSSSYSAILSILQARQNDTEEHMTRLQNLAIALGRKASLPEKQHSELRMLARLHDIGKLVLSDSVLLKAGPLDNEEWDLVRQHPSIGARIVEMIPNLRQLSPAILAHHERWDGSGYPNRLAGEQIPLTARIISLVDAWDAMTNDRPYRKALSFDQAFQEIRINSGKQFDPVLSKLFMDILLQAQTESFQHRMASLLESASLLAG